MRTCHKVPQVRVILPGQYYDQETGLHYNMVRYYDPTLDRYITSDPMRLRGGMNTYTYVDSNPINYIDPMGLWKWYGNWGGPDWTGGQEGTWNDVDRSKALPPQDAQDVCYQAHDICYGDCRDCSASKSDFRGECFKSCDRELATCLGNLGDDPSNNWRAKRARRYFSNSNPSPD